MPDNMMELFVFWTSFGLGERPKTFWGCLIHAIIWGIWKERNRRIFDGKINSWNEVIDGIIQEVGGWLFVDEAF